MPIEARYHEQVRLLVSLLPFLSDEPCFALKGGTAINLFVQPLPRRHRPGLPAAGAP
ncbi:nucleotidyl transferase AbiEii/AbiGii toxin family protein [Modicisalibacter radicis]|uniref:nucleotidyl transferase AbiEii/AbiGii toxin family protein n=1 Tax=Halomonas sp. EAR18 TaxID=2518972 RepID=UPI001FCE4EBE|nr:nucleotidyl transferase AbiEii/AbiGii toxin family protein [Halomonas sp. EAR18]